MVTVRWGQGRRVRVRGNHSILQGFLKAGSNFLSLGTPLPGRRPRNLVKLCNRKNYQSFKIPADSTAEIPQSVLPLYPVSLSRRF
jgi:hypothetical protein